MEILCLAVLSAIPREQCCRDVVDVIEVNHVLDGNGSLVFDQVIFWRWRPLESHYRVVGWRMLRNVREEPPIKQMRAEPKCWKPPKWKGGHATPIRRHDRGGWWLSQWRDEKDRVFREVAAPMYRETWTLHDPEVDDRKWLPDNRREGLAKPKRRK